MKETISKKKMKFEKEIYELYVTIFFTWMIVGLSILLQTIPLSNLNKHLIGWLILLSGFLLLCVYGYKSRLYVE